MNLKKIFPLVILVGVLMPAGAAVTERDSIKKEAFGKAEGRNVNLYTLTNRNGAEAKIATYGATLVSLRVPDRNGRVDDVVLGFDDIDGYLKGTAFFGA